MQTVKLLYLGKIANIKILEKEFGKLQTDIVIVTQERISHIKDRHPEDYNLFEQYAEKCVVSPDMILKDSKHNGTVFMLKQLPDANLNIVVRVALGTDEKGFKNSIMTFYRIRNKNVTGHTLARTY
ncbi:MAG: hypothetical protein LUD18_14230 [Lachnospiraceae bacterium]|nr:hypothetical protein [Lachnospiraceae bacterium]